MSDNPKMLTDQKRDVRVDFFRGVALYMILVDHVQGDPFSKFTFQHFGFSDAAELFVFLSGISCAIVYSRLLARRGWASVLQALAKRTTKIYGFFVVTSALVIFAISVAASATHADFSHNWYTTLTADPLSSLWAAVLLKSPPALPGILVLYLVLTAIAIPTFLWLAQRDPHVALGVSAAIWALAQFDPDLVPRIAEQSYFNWLGWQFVFCIGMFIGLQRQKASEISPGLRTVAIGVAWVIVIGAFSYVMALKVLRHIDFDITPFKLSDVTISHMKENASVVRLAHFLSVALLVATYFKSSDWIFGNRASAVIIETGRFSLEVFCLCAIIDVLLNLWVLIGYPTTLNRIVLDCAAFGLIVLVVMAMARRREQRREFSRVRMG
jgi:hypothetical protein